MLEPREQLAFSYLLTKVFAYYNVDLSNETPSLGKKGIGSPTINRIFSPHDDHVKILDGETVVEEDARLQKFYCDKISGQKRKEVDRDDEEGKDLSLSSESEKGGKSVGLNKKFNYLKNKVKKLNSKFKKIQELVISDLDEIKWNIKNLFQ